MPTVTSAAPHVPPVAPNNVADSTDDAGGCPAARSSARADPKAMHDDLVKRYHAALKQRDINRQNDLLRRMFRGWRSTTRAKTASTAENGTAASAPMAVDNDGGVPSTPSPNMPADDARLQIPHLAASSARSRSALRRDPNHMPIEALPRARTFRDKLNMLSDRVWDVETPREMQYTGVKTALREGKAIVVDRTGGGKSHLIRLLGTMLRGLNIVFHPLLALMGDQVAKFREGRDDHGAIETHNIDEIGGHPKLSNQLLPVRLSFANAQQQQCFGSSLHRRLLPRGGFYALLLLMRYTCGQNMAQAFAQRCES